MGGDDISIDADPGVLTDPSPDVNETIVIDNTNSTLGVGAGLLLRNTTAGQVATVSNFSLTNGGSGMRIVSNSGTLNVNQAVLDGGTGNGFDLQTNAGESGQKE